MAISHTAATLSPQTTRFVFDPFFGCSSLIGLLLSRFASV